MIRFLTLVLAASSLLSVSCAQMKAKGDCATCDTCDSKAKPAAAACCSSTKPHKH